MVALTKSKPRVIPRLANTLSTVRKKGAAGKWEVQFYDNTGTRRSRSVVAGTEDEARKAGKALIEELRGTTLTPRKNIFSSKEINSVIDAAVADGRIAPESGKFLKSLPIGRRKSDTRHLSEVIDGKLVYKKIEETPWNRLTFKLGKREKINLQDRVSSKLRLAEKVSADVYQKLFDEIKYVKEALNPDQLLEWEKRFNSKYAELVGEWKSAAYRHLKMTPENWAKVNIRKHAEREFIRDGYAKNTARFKARDFVNTLSKPDLVDWHNVLIPIKKYNDRIYNYALGKNSPDALTDLLEVHHLQPIGEGGTTRSALNIAGVTRGMAGGSEHANVHNKLFNSFYENLKGQGVTVGEYVPPGSGGVKTKMFGPHGEVLSADEWVPGVGEGTTKPPAKVSLMNFLDNPTARNVGQNIWSAVKPAAKVVGRAAPFAAIPFAAEATARHQLAGNEKLAMLSAISGHPNPLISWPALLGEWAGGFWNRETGRERFPEGQQGWRQSLLDPNWRGDR